MAQLDGNLWEFNLAKVVVVDVSDDYRLMQKPMPSEFYPVVAEHWVPAYNVDKEIATGSLNQGYAYDWHEGPQGETGAWYVGVVRDGLAQES